MNEILIPIIGAGVFIFIGLWLAFISLHRYITFAIIVAVLTVLAGSFLYLYDNRLGYAVSKEIPEKFTFLYYVQKNEIHYVWLIADGSTEPRVYIVDAKKFKKIQKDGSKANQNVREGMAVRGKRQKGDGDTESDESLHFNIVKPDNQQK